MALVVVVEHLPAEMLLNVVEHALVHLPDITNLPFASLNQVEEILDGHTPIRVCIRKASILGELGGCAASNQEPCC